MADGFHPEAASPWIARFAPLIQAGGEVLDLACGSGRHARLLAEMGYRVEAVDRDAEALATLDGVANVTTRLPLHTHRSVRGPGTRSWLPKVRTKRAARQGLGW